MKLLKKFKTSFSKTDAEQKAAKLKALMKNGRALATLFQKKHQKGVIEYDPNTGSPEPTAAQIRHAQLQIPEMQLEVSEELATLLEKNEIRSILARFRDGLMASVKEITTTESTNENPTQQLTLLLKEKGIEDPNVKELLNNWTIEQEKQVNKSNTPDAEIQFNLQRARLYLEAGYVEEALENFEAAQTQAWNEHRTELHEAITQEILKIQVL